jgi:hypothetical protein
MHHRAAAFEFLSVGNGIPMKQINEKETYMRILIPALAAASMLMIALPGYSADDVKSGGTSTKPARALDDSSAVKQGGSTNKPARAIDDGTVKSAGTSDKPGRAIEDGAVKSGGGASKPGRAVDDTSVKSAGSSDKPGRAVDAEKKSKKKKKKVQPQN